MSTVCFPWFTLNDAGLDKSFVQPVTTCFLYFEFESCFLVIIVVPANIIYHIVEDIHFWFSNITTIAMTNVNVEVRH